MVGEQNTAAVELTVIWFGQLGDVLSMVHVFSK